MKYRLFLFFGLCCLLGTVACSSKDQTDLRGNYAAMDAKLSLDAPMGYLNFTTEDFVLDCEKDPAQTYLFSEMGGFEKGDKEMKRHEYQVRLYHACERGDQWRTAIAKIAVNGDTATVDMVRSQHSVTNSNLGRMEMNVRYQCQDTWKKTAEGWKLAKQHVVDVVMGK